jgi:hypothetical protein
MRNFLIHEYLHLDSVVGFVFHWRTDTAVSSAFCAFPLCLAGRFVRFSRRIREPYGCSEHRTSGSHPVFRERSRESVTPCDGQPVIPR